MALHGPEHREFECLGVEGITAVEALDAVRSVGINPALNV